MENKNISNLAGKTNGLRYITWAFTPIFRHSSKIFENHIFDLKMSYISTFSLGNTFISKDSWKTKIVSNSARKAYGLKPITCVFTLIFRPFSKLFENPIFHLKMSYFSTLPLNSTFISKDEWKTKLFQIWQEKLMILDTLH